MKVFHPENILNGFFINRIFSRPFRKISNPRVILRSFSLKEINFIHRTLKINFIEKSFLFLRVEDEELNRKKLWKNIICKREREGDRDRFLYLDFMGLSLIADFQDHLGVNF